MASKISGWLLALFNEKTKAPGVQNAYHAVSILPGSKACSAAYRFFGPRFLSRQAPRLPLPGCDATSCDCRFKHYRDRRAQPRRNSDVGIMSASFADKERRHSRGRRAEDQF